MSARFLDTNVLIYSLSQEPRKQNIALSLLAARPVVSVQVLSENANVMRRKLGYSIAETRSVTERIARECDAIQPLTIATLQSGLTLSERYGFSHYDSLIVAAALEAGCTDLYSEDMQNGQEIGNRLRIINPFL
jgi:predicted nucleic acid-binding protein